MTTVSTVLFLLMITAFFAALGRSATPPAERVPWWTWTGRDVVANVVNGFRVLDALDEPRRRRWEARLDELQSRHPSQRTRS